MASGYGAWCELRTTTKGMLKKTRRVEKDGLRPRLAGPSAGLPQAASGTELHVLHHWGPRRAPGGRLWLTKKREPYPPGREALLSAHGRFETLDSSRPLTQLAHRAAPSRIACTSLHVADVSTLPNRVPSRGHVPAARAGRTPCR